MCHGHMKKYKAIALFSGGLDSILAVKWMQSRGYTVHSIYFRAPYMEADRAILSAKQNNIELEVIDVSEEHIMLLDKPVYGFGKRLNPCIDCHGFMFRKAAELLIARDADYLISGEVLGQRPMSQRRDSLDSVAKLSGVKDLIVRPLSQALLNDTLPIREGWVAKSDMLRFNGRGRTDQLNLAHKLGIKEYPHPAGGCLLTDRNYCLRLQDLIDSKELTLENLELLSYGRHFRMGDGDSYKLIIGREEADNNALEGVFKNGYMLLAKDIMGPLGLIIGDNITELDLRTAIDLFLYYNTKAPEELTVQITKHKDGKQIGDMFELVATKLNQEAIKQYRISYD